MGHSTTRAALIYLHNTAGRDKKIDLSDVLAQAASSTPPSSAVPDRLPDEDEVLPVTSVRIRASALEELDKLGGRDGRSRLIRQAIDEFLARRRLVT